MNTPNNDTAAALATDAARVDENSRGRQFQFHSRCVFGQYRIANHPPGVLVYVEGRVRPRVCTQATDASALPCPGNSLTDARAEDFIIETDAVDSTLKSRFRLDAQDIDACRRL